MTKPTFADVGVTGLAIARQSLPVLLLALQCATLPGCQALRYHGQIKTAMFSPRQIDRARLDVQGRVPILHLRGTPEEMGRQYGELMRPALQGLSGYARCLLSAAQRERLLDYARRHEQYLPDEIRQQLRTMAAAGGMDYDELVALNITPRLMCSTLAVWGPSTADGRMLMGRNGDYWGLGLDDCGSLLVVYHPTGGEPVALVSFLGMAGGFAGMNGHGVAFGNMLVLNSPGRREEGLPIQLAMRLAAENTGSAREMADRLAGMAHVIPNNVMVADASFAFVAELGPDQSHIRSAAGGVLAASNNFLEHPDRSNAGRCPRYDSLVRAAGDNRGGMTVEKMKAALFNARILGINMQATVFEPADMRMHVSINRNPASAGPYETLDVRRLLAE